MLVTSLPRNLTLPDEGRIAPAMTPKSVVLPAPFGPMKPQIVFSGMSKLTSFKAATPPKYFVNAFTSRITPTPPNDSVKQAHEAVGFYQHNEHQQSAVEQKMDVGEVRDQLLLNGSENYAAQHRSPNRANAPYYGHQQDRDAGIEGEHSLRIDVRVITGKNCASHPRKRRCNRVNIQLANVGVHAHIGGSVFILSDGAQGQAKPAPGDYRRDRYCDRRRAQGGVIVLNLAVRAMLAKPQSARSAGNGKIAHEHAYSFVDSDGCDHKVRAAQAKCWRANNQGGN